jgi:hypothetical protein
MSKYIKITNEVNEVPRLYLELLGVSTKRDDNTTIGQFGSGSKFAPILALRKDWEWVSVGSDSSGDYTMSYSWNDDNNMGLEVVQFDYKLGDGSSFSKESSYSLGAGELGWDSPFMIFREAFANAIDAHLEFGTSYSVDIVDSIGEPVDGEFSVYLTAADELVEIVDNFDKYFSFNREPLFKSDNGQVIYSKLDDDEFLRVYHRGVLVHGPELCDGYEAEYKSIFDYGLTDVNINEDRTLSSLNSNELSHVANIFTKNAYYEGRDVVGSFDDVIEYVVKNNLYHPYFNSDPEEPVWEFQYSSNYIIYDWSVGYEDTISSFADKFIALCDERFCIDGVYDRVAFINSKGYSSDDTIVSLKERGAFGLVVCEAIYEAIRSTGGRERIDVNILGEILDVPYIDINGSAKTVFDFALACVAKYDKRILGVPIKVMEESVRNMAIAGKALNVKNSSIDSLIVLNQNILIPQKIEMVVSTLIHELDHVLSGASDNTREFRDIADNRLGSLVVDHYSDMSRFIEVSQMEDSND